MEKKKKCKRTVGDEEGKARLVRILNVVVWMYVYPYMISISLLDGIEAFFGLGLLVFS